MLKHEGRARALRQPSTAVSVNADDRAPDAHDLSLKSLWQTAHLPVAQHSLQTACKLILLDFFEGSHKDFIRLQRSIPEVGPDDQPT
eukprot:268333-Heterocapsa_arctica.AAC.1